MIDVELINGPLDGLQVKVTEETLLIECKSDEKIFMYRMMDDPHKYEYIGEYKPRDEDY